ncbi:MAG: hypothetical protein ACT4PK_09680 [Gammaproteobacteria bacterium]
MNLMRSLVPLLALLAAGTAQAGGTGAGAGSAIGSVINPGSHATLGAPSKDERQKRVLPGNGGSVSLAGDQLAKVAEQLRAFNGATVLGSTISAPTVLADGTAAVIALDTRTGRLTVTRREN